MKYVIKGGSFPAATVTLNKGESVFTQSGAMAWADNDVEMTTDMTGGFLKSLGRALSGTSLMFVTHKAIRDDSNITFSASFPGTIKEFVVDENNEYIAQKSAFLVGEDGVVVDAVANKKIFAGLFGGEGIFLQKISGHGSALIEIDGAVEEIDLKEGETIKVETGHVALFESRVNYDIESVKGLKNIFFGGQGLFVTTLTGPGKVYLQTLTAQDMAQKLIPYIPKEHSNVSIGSNGSDND